MSMMLLFIYERFINEKYVKDHEFGISRIIIKILKLESGEWLGYSLI